MRGDRATCQLAFPHLVSISAPHIVARRPFRLVGRKLPDIAISVFGRGSWSDCTK